MYKPKILLSVHKKLQYYVDAVNGTGSIADARCLLLSSASSGTRKE